MARKYLSTHYFRTRLWPPDEELSHINIFIYHNNSNSVGCQHIGIWGCSCGSLLIFKEVSSPALVRCRFGAHLRQGPEILGCICICLHSWELKEAANPGFPRYIGRIWEFSSLSFIPPRREQGLSITVEEWFWISVCNLSEFLNDVWNSLMEITLRAYCTCKNSLERM